MKKSRCKPNELRAPTNVKERKKIKWVILNQIGKIKEELIKEDLWAGMYNKIKFLFYYLKNSVLSLLKIFVFTPALGYFTIFRFTSNSLE